MSCLMKLCNNTKYRSKNSDTRFFTFPQNGYIRRRWLAACGLSEDDLPKFPLVCSSHFSPNDMVTKQKSVRLTRNAIPQGGSSSPNVLVQATNEFLKFHYDVPTAVARYSVSSKSCNKIMKTISISTQTDSSIDVFKNENEILKQKLEECFQIIAFLKNEQKVAQEKSVFTENQQEMLINSPNNPRYETDDISSSIAIYAAGPRCYKLLRRRHFPLPSISTLRRWALKLNVESGIQRAIISLMEGHQLNIDDKLCVLSFDEMKCREEWAWDRSNDIIIPPKKQVQVLMCRGVKGRWKQPLYYDFDQKMTAESLNAIFCELHYIGFTVVATVCDLGLENQSFIKKMGVSAAKPYFEHPLEKEHKIFVLSDIPHLLKLLRNYFVDSGFMYNGKLSNKSIIEELLAINNLDLNTTKSITIDMLNVKGAARQKVKYAAKLFSHTIATALRRCAELGLCSDAEKFLECSELFQRINNWFDVFNSQVIAKDSRPLKKAFGLAVEEQFEAITKMNEIVPHFLPARKSGAMLPFINAIISNNAAFPLLYNHLKEHYGIKFVITAKLNQDCVENFFSAIRANGGLHDHPSPMEFKYRLRSYFLGHEENILYSESNTKDTQDNLLVNCEPEEILTQTTMKNLLNVSEKTISKEEDIPADAFEDEMWQDIAPLTDSEYDGLENFGGYLIHKMNLSQYGNRTGKGDQNYYSYVDTLTEGGLMKPNAIFMNILEKLNSIFITTNKYMELTSAPNYLQSMMHNASDIDIADNVKRRFFTGRTFFRIRFLNRQIRELKKDSRAQKKK